MLHHMLRAAAQRAFSVLDPYFQYVTMLLHGDGTNGAQNNTFLDSSTNNFTITRNGNTTQGTFTPYGSNWSNYFGGGSNYLDFPSNAAYGMGTGDFTIEAWLYPTAAWAGAGSYNPIFLVNGTGGLYFGQNSAGFGLRQSGTANIISYGTSPTLNTWTHVAIVRSGTTVTMYYNGTSVATATSSANFTSGTLTIANDGSYGIPAQYISNLRIVKGTAVYTGAFTPSTAPLTAISGTSLLVCQSNRFVDNSSNAAAITVTGSPSVQRFSPFSPTTAYSTSVIGGSGYFDGTGDSLSVATTTALSFGTGDFTIEGWVYKTAAANASFVDGRVNPGGASPWAFYVDGSNFPYFYDGSVYSSSVAISLNSWNHIVAVRTSGTLKIFVNGVQGYSATLSTNLDRSAGAFIGVAANTSSPSAYWQGYINDLRIVKGTAVYTAAFTPPTAPLTAITNTSLLLNYTNAGILDNAMMNNLETVGNAQISTSVKKYGTGSMYFDGNGDYLVHPFTPAINFSSGSFTIECWVYPTANQTDNWIYGVEASGTGYYVLRIVTTNKLQFIWNNFASSVTSTGTLSLNTWTHIAVSCTGSTVTLYINGTSDGSTSISGITAAPSGTQGCIGNQIGLSRFWNGYIDDLRITRGVARYVANFTPPTAAFPNN